MSSIKTFKLQEYVQLEPHCSSFNLGMARGFGGEMKEGEEDKGGWEISTRTQRRSPGPNSSSCFTDSHASRTHTEFHFSVFSGCCLWCEFFWLCLSISATEGAAWTYYKFCSMPSFLSSFSRHSVSFMLSMYLNMSGTLSLCQCWGRESVTRPKITRSLAAVILLTVSVGEYTNRRLRIISSQDTNDPIW